ncbi:MAG: hypothetical protein L0Y38_01700 [Methylococcaceae bacterium]|nr:hypothetical protein [Methylococcaceae bacterium]
MSRKFIIVGFSMALFASLCIILTLCIQIRLYSTQLAGFKQAESFRSKEIEEMKTRMTELEVEIAEMVQSRLPNLKELAFDKVIEIDHRYVKNIVFTLTGKNGHKSFEYKTVLENSGTEAIEPAAKVIFFDRLGIQIGQANIENDVPGSDQGLLDPGEVRSFYNSIQFAESLLPRYFRVVLENAE